VSNLVILPALLISLICGSLLLIRGIWRLVYGTQKNFVIDMACVLMVFLSASLLAIDAIQEARTLLSRNAELLANLGCFLLFAVVVFFAYLTVQSHGEAGVVRKHVYSWISLVIALTISSWSYYRIQARSHEFCFFGDAAPIPGEVERDDRAFGITDKGNYIPLYRLDTDFSTFVNYSETADGKYISFVHEGIERNGPDQNANCHGWVFTDGRFLLKGDDVDVILADNGYVQVASPEPGDIVIYRDSSERILHTALVQGILRDGTIISESKWGVDKRFLHLPDDQPYSTIYHYYRTTRSHHLIEILSSSEGGHLIGG
jgi:hypothetical protein